MNFYPVQFEPRLMRYIERSGITETAGIEGVKAVGPITVYADHVHVPYVTRGAEIGLAVDINLDLLALLKELFAEEPAQAALLDLLFAGVTDLLGILKQL